MGSQILLMVQTLKIKITSLESEVTQESFPLPFFEKVSVCLRSANYNPDLSCVAQACQSKW